MSNTLSKSRLAMALSALDGFNKPKVRQEQYLMDSEIGASMLWTAYLIGDIKGKLIADLGCGTGVLGIGALLLEAKCVRFIDLDENALEMAKNNVLKVKSEGYDLGKAEFVCKNIKDLEMKVDVVIQNPPFGTKVRHNDIIFLEKAFETAPVVYSFHKSEAKHFLEQFSTKKDSKITHIWNFRFPLKATLEFHRRRIYRIDVSCFRFEKQFFLKVKTKIFK